MFIEGVQSIVFIRQIQCILCLIPYLYTVFLLPCRVYFCYLPIHSHLYELTWYIGDEDFQMGRIKLRKGRAKLIAKGEVGAAKSSYCTRIPSHLAKDIKNDHNSHYRH